MLDLRLRIIPFKNIHHFRYVIIVFIIKNKLYLLHIISSPPQTTLVLHMAAKKYPACFTAFDILYYEDRQVTDLPLTERKALLKKAVKSDDSRFAVSRFIEKNSIRFYNLTEQQDLEGIVAKHKDSKYYFDRRTKNWIKIKYLQDDDFIVLGFDPKENSLNSIILGQYNGGKLVYKGHVTLGVGGEPFKK